MEYQPTIGLEIHAELKTATKMFCDCRNDPGQQHPNVNVCPVCLGHPGTLPVPNQKAIESIIRVGLALGGTIAPFTKFDRKNYFYPDLPKGYQISQYDQPLVSGGSLNNIRLTRIHLEEDAGRLAHVEGATAVDYNRAGLSLMELVTEPDLRSARETAEFARELQLILRYLGVSDADMEKGQMRIEANVSLNMGTKVELKNINSFRAVTEAIEYEVKRQIALLEKGEKVRQSTRGWNEAKRETVHQRFKEDAHDYRYFPEPDIPPFDTAVFSPEVLQAQQPELPAAKRERLVSEYALTPDQAALLAAEKPLADFFEAAISEFAAQDETRDEAGRRKGRDLVFSYLMTDMRGLMNETKTPLEKLKITPEHLAHLASLIVSGTIGSRQAKDILHTMHERGEDPETILEAEGLHTISDTAQLVESIKEVIAENPGPVAQYKAGKESVLQFFVGKTMGKLKGRGDPETLKQIIKEQLTAA